MNIFCSEPQIGCAWWFIWRHENKKLSKFLQRLKNYTEAITAKYCGILLENICHQNSFEVRGKQYNAAVTVSLNVKRVQNHADWED